MPRHGAGWLSTLCWRPGECPTSWICALGCRLMQCIYGWGVDSANTAEHDRGSRLANPTTQRENEHGKFEQKWVSAHRPLGDSSTCCNHHGLKSIVYHLSRFNSWQNYFRYNKTKGLLKHDDGLPNPVRLPLTWAVTAVFCSFKGPFIPQIHSGLLAKVFRSTQHNGGERNVVYGA